MRKCNLMILFTSAAVGLCVATATPSASAAETLSYADLVQRLTGLERLAVLPVPGETCRQWSSYDRASKFDEKSGKYVHWDANGDNAGIIRREGKQEVFAEMQGPGCIWRIWSAMAMRGHVKIYLDGNPQPVVDLPFADYFDGKHAPFNYPQLSYNLADVGCRGQNLYFPIPYQKSCKIVADEKWGGYYHFGYETFPEGTKVPTFSPELVRENAAALKAVNDFFRDNLGTDPAGKRQDEQITAVQIQATPGNAAKVAQLAGPQAITAIRVKMSFADRKDQMAALRELALRITWDGRKEPAVWCPLGDFFGTAPGENKYKSLPTGMTDDGFYALWYMPFATSALVEVANDGKQDRKLDFQIVHAPLSRPMAELGHFHCKWHRDVFPLAKDRFPDWVMLQTTGRGRFCGVMLHVWNPRGGWWGEGDEKFFVDGEKFPSTFGTGSEDYFGYAWGDPHLFQHPFHCQTMTENNAGHQSLLRWHIVDNVPFQKSFEGDLEKYFPNKRSLFACTVCWYLSPDGQEPFGPAPVQERHGYAVTKPLSSGGLTVLGKTGGNVEIQDMTFFGAGKWREDDQLWWTGAKPGNKLDLSFTAKKAGRYKVNAGLTKAIDFGIVQIYLDGQKAGGPIDLCHQGIVPSTPPTPLGVFDLTAGNHKLTVEIVGANPKSKGYLFGIDYLDLQPE